MEPLASSILPILELYVAHTAQPIHTDTPVPSHAMLYTYTAAAYTQSSYQNFNGNQCNPIKARDIES